MSPFLLTVLFFGLVTASKDEIKHSRNKRSLVGLCSMIASQTNYGMCLRLLNHGNHCGPLRNSGPRIDALDQCCFNHDRCSEATRMPCGSPLMGIVFGAYRWVISPTDRRIHCVQTFGQCAHAQCMCDSQFATCVGAVTRANLQSLIDTTRTATRTATGMGPATRTATGMGPTGMGPTGMRPTGMGPTGMRPTGMGPTGMGPTGMGPTGMGPTGMGPTGMGPTGMRPTGIGPTGMGPTGMGPTRMGPTAGMGPTGMGPTGMGPTGMGPTGAGPTGMGPTGMGPTGMGPTGMGPTGTGPTGMGPTGMGPATGILSRIFPGIGMLTGLLPGIGSAPGMLPDIGSAPGIGTGIGPAAMHFRPMNTITNTNTRIMGMTPFQSQRRNHPHQFFFRSM